MGREFGQDERGSIAILMAVMLTVIMGFGALAVDISHSYGVKAKLTTTAEMSALAAAQQLPTTSNATTAALDLASRNAPANYGVVTKAADVTFGTYDTSTKAFTASASSINAVRVCARRTAQNGNAAPSFFGRVFGSTSTDIVYCSVASRSGPTACVIALASTGTGTLSATGGGSLQVPNCGAWVNSNSNTALKAGNNTAITAKSFCVVGGYQGSTISPTPVTGCPVMADPLASIPEPTAGACTATNYSNNGLTTSINPGTYCGTFSVTGGTLTLNAGLYYFKGSSISIGTGASLVSAGSGVTLFLDSTSSLTHSAAGTTNLVASKSGTYKGLLIFQSRSAVGISNKLTGSSYYMMDGTIYTPKSSLTLTGSTTINNSAKSGYVIANDFTFNGSADFIFDAYSGVAPVGLSNQVALVQ